MELSNALGMIVFLHGVWLSKNGGRTCEFMNLSAFFFL